MVHPRAEAVITVNEFVLAFFGVVIGLGVSDLLMSFHRLLRAGTRVKWDWLPLTYAGLMLYAMIVFWWWQFGYPPSGQELTIASFLPRFVFLVLTFLMVAAALPDDIPAEGISLRAFYFESLRHRWGLLLIALTLSLAIEEYNLFRRADWVGVGWTSLPIVSAVLAALAMRIKKPWFQALVMGWIFAVTSYFNLFRTIGP